MSINIEDVPKLPGVYKITNNVNGKIYIGKSVNLQRRMTDYRDAERLPLPEGSGRFLQAIKKYGFEGFSLEILELHQERVIEVYLEFFENILKERQISCAA